MAGSGGVGAIVGGGPSHKKQTRHTVGRYGGKYSNSRDVFCMLAAKSRQRLLDAEGPFDNHCQQHRCGQDHRSGQL